MSAEALVRNVVPLLHPRYYAGVVAWGETTRYLRDAMSSMNVLWSPEPVSHLPASVVPDGGASAMQSTLHLPYGPHEVDGYQIVVAGGDARTGTVANKAPGCANLKGHLMVQAVNANNGQFPIFTVGNATTKVNPQGNLNLEDEVAIDNQTASLMTNLATWVLLVRFDTNGVFAELSRPLAITKRGKISSWSNRIILGRIGSSGGIQLSMGSIGPAPEFDFGMTDDLGEDALVGE